MSNKLPPPLPYGKQISTPLPAPDTSSAVNTVQLPENVMWMSGNRGFTKRPGSLPFAASNVSSAFFFDFGNAPRNWPCALLSVRSPSTYLTSSAATENYADAQTLIGVQWDSFMALRRQKAALTAETTVLMRAPYVRNDSNYYFYNNTSLTPLITAATTSVVGDVVSSIGASASFNSSGQQATLALQATPEPVFNAVYPRGSTQKPLTTHQAVMVPNSNNQNGVVMRTGGNIGRVDAVNLGGDVLIGGASGSLWHYDGYRCYTAGAYDLAAANPSSGSPTWQSILAAGALTGTYQYMMTQVARLPSGETIESNPLVSPTISPAAQGVDVRLALGNLTAGNALFNTLIGKEYRLENFTITGAVGSTVTIQETHNLQAGEHICFVTTAGVVSTAQIASVAGQTLTITGTIPGTAAYLTTGGSFRLYRTKAGGSIFYVVREFALGQVPGGAPYSWMIDATADGSLGAQFTATATTREAAPAGVVSMTSHQGRIVVLTGGSSGQVEVAVNAGPPTVAYSSGTSKFYYPAANSFALSDSGSQPKGLVSVNDTLYVFSGNAIEMVVGSLDDASTFTVNTLTSALGCMDGRSLINIDGHIYFRSQNGLARLSGTTIDHSWSAPINSYLQSSDVKTSCYYWRSKNLLLVALLNPLAVTRWNGNTAYDPTLDQAAGVLPSGESPSTMYLQGAKPGITLVYDFNNQKWAVWNIDCYNGAVEEGASGDLIVAPPCADNTNTTYYTRFSSACNWTDSGVPFTARWYSEWYDAGVPSVDKSFDRAQIFSTDTKEAGGQGFKLTVSTERDWQPGLTVDQFVDLPDFKVGTAYAETGYGSQPYGDPELSQKVLNLSNQRCKSLRLVVENSEPNRNFAINGASVEVSPKFVNMKDE